MQSIIRSIRNVFRNRGRMILIVTLLSLSLMFVAAMTSLSTNSQQELATVHKLVGNTINIAYATSQTSATPQPNPGSGGGVGFFGNGPTPIPDGVVTQVKHVQGVVSTQVSVQRMDQDNDLQGTTMTTPDGQSMSAPVGVHGIDPTTSASFTIPPGITPILVSGRAFRASDANADVAMMSQALAQVNHLSVGSTFTLKGKTFSLIGLYTPSPSNLIGDSTAIIPIAIMEKLFQTHGVDSITATVASYEQAEPVAAKLRRALGNKFAVTTQTAQYSQVFSALQVAQQSIQIAQVVSLVIAAAVIIFAVFQLVRERTSEIAINKALGSSHLQVLQQFWIEIVVLSTIAAALAILLLVTLGPFVAQRFDIDPASLVKASSAPGQNFFTSVIGGPTTSLNANPLSGVHLAAATLNPETLLIIVGIGMGLALLASFIPTWFVSTIKPAQVLRAA